MASWHQRQGIRRALKQGRRVIPAGFNVNVTTDGFTSWIGPFPSKDEAETHAATMRKNGASAIAVDGGSE